MIFGGLVLFVATVAMLTIVLYIHSIISMHLFYYACKTKARLVNDVLALQSRKSGFDYLTYIICEGEAGEFSTCEVFNEKKKRCGYSPLR